MKTYTIQFTRNDSAELNWQQWLIGYPSFEFASKEVLKLKERNKDFDFKVVKGVDE